MKQTQETRQKDYQSENKKLLCRLINKGVLVLEPTLDKLGVRYIEAEEAWKESDSTHVKGILEKLEREGALKSEFIDRVLTCPDCDSADVHSKYTCPKCSSRNAEYTELLEHMKCGYIDSKDKFKRNASLVCPHCQEQLTEETVHYRVVGNCYQCKKCGYRFDKPEIIHVCQKCKRTFNHQEAKYPKVLAYKIRDETINDLGRELPILESIEKALVAKDFKVQLHPKLTGASGVPHPFDILAEKGQTRLVIDISITGNKNDMISLLGKKVDVNPTKAIIIDLSNVDELTQLGKVYDIMVFKATNIHNLNTRFGSFLLTLDSEKTCQHPVT